MYWRKAGKIIIVELEQIDNTEIMKQLWHYQYKQFTAIPHSRATRKPPHLGRQKCKNKSFYKAETKLVYT